jgi:hypothetical protein
MRDADLGDLSYRGFALATVTLMLLAGGAYLTLPFGQVRPPRQIDEAALAREIGVLRGRLDEMSKVDVAISQRLEVLEKALPQDQPPGPPATQGRSKHRP